MPQEKSICRPLKAWIDAKAFRNNIDHLQSLAPNSELLLVVKADAYGHGVKNIIHECGDNRVAVASADEAQTLLGLGFSNQIVLLEGPFSYECLRALQGKDVVWVVHSLTQLHMMAEFGVEQNIWLKLDTGMHRLGLLPEEFGQAMGIINAAETLNLDAVMSHFSSADEIESNKTSRQIDTFNRLIEKHSLQNLPQSLCNSAGLIFHPIAHKQIVRPGIALYGGWCSPKYDKSREGLLPVMRLESEVIAVREIDQEEAVGYGETWRAKQKARIATIAIGYGDGYPRHAPAGTPIVVNGQRAKLVGRVSMDMITADVTHLSGVVVGSKVELWGSNLPVEEVAQAIGTISYEMTTGLTARVPRLIFAD